MQTKTVLVLGATGTMGRYLVPELLKMGYKVDAVSLDDETSDNENLRYFKYNCFDDELLSKQLENHYDGVVDFMHYGNEEFFLKRSKLVLDNTDHYIFLSSYRVYADKQIPVTEEAPRILETSTDEKFLSTPNYALQKCMGEDVLQNSGKKNWTVVRPVIIFSSTRFAAITLEAGTIFNRAKEGKPVLFPEVARNVHAAVMWGGDAARMIAALLFNEKAYGERFTLATGEKLTWEEYISYFEEYIGLKPMWIDKEQHLSIMSDNPEIQLVHRWGLENDRGLERIMDNSKVLSVTGIKNESLKSAKEALKIELDKVPVGMVWTESGIHEGVSKRMDKYLEVQGK